jgi:serine/threonine-protein kinase
MASMTADRNLLFGLLALQNGLIDQGQLVAAFQAWTRDKGRGLADHLIGRGELDGEQRALLEGLVAQHLKKHGGDAEQSLAAIPAGRSTRESLARIGDPDLGGTLAHIGSSSPQHRDEGGTETDRTATYSVGTATSDGQRFRILRPHARGGLGAVFVAMDTELHREVALKQILDQHADDPVSRQRFLIEAEVTGGLEHPGIVPVYGLGTYGGGRPYYAMRFVRGDSLKEAIEQFHADQGVKKNPGRRSLELRKLLRRFLDVCNAIEYAHSRGVLHRDVKPGNVIVGRHGETLVVDWGLAKPLGRAEPGSAAGERMLMPSSASGSSETLPGSALGTPAYMSPEQARGDLDRLGPRSDVYSLGATLYCLLTGRPPVEGDDLGVLLQKVQRSAFARPRQLDPAIDPALEAVCLKAMALEPTERYSSCRALADDVERWMADEPVTAHRESLGRRARRWANRNRTAVTAAAVALVAGLAGLVAIAAVQARANGSLAVKNRELTQANVRVLKANAALETANAATARANGELKAANTKIEARYNLAVDAIRTFHTGVSEDFLLKETQFRELRDRLLKSASDFYDKLGALLQDGADLPSRRALLLANYEVAALADQVGRREDALALHRRVLAGREALATVAGADPDLAVDVARSRLAVGMVLEATGRTGEALAAYEHARKAVAAADRAAAKGASARSALADAEYRAGWLLRAMGRTTDALRAAERARDVQATLAASSPTDRDRQAALARSQNLIALLFEDAGRPAEALTAFQASRAIRQALAQAHPTVTQYQVEIANTQGNIGSLLRLTRPAEATAALEAARAIRQKLAEAHPAVSQFQEGLARSLHDLGWDLVTKGKFGEALTTYEAGRAIRRKLAEAHPGVTDFQSGLASSQEMLSVLLSVAGRRAEAREAEEAALVIRKKLAEAHPDITLLQENLARSLADLGNRLKRERKPAEALAEYQSALAIRQKLAQAHPEVTQFQQSLANGYDDIGEMLCLDGKLAEGLPQSQAALAIREKLAKTHPGDLIIQSHWAFSHVRMGRLLVENGRPAEAEAQYRQALAMQQTQADQNPDVTFPRFYAASTRVKLGDLCWQTGDARGAETEWRTALATLRELVRDTPEARNERSLVAWILLQLGSLLSRAGKLSEAEAKSREALANWQKLAADHPTDPEYRDSVADGFTGLADLLRQQGRTAEARDAADRAVAFREGLVREDPSSQNYATSLASSLRERAMTRLALGDVAGAATDARRALAIWDAQPWHSGSAWLETALCHATLAAPAGRAGSVVPADGAATEADAAMASLRKAIEMGCRNAGAFRTEPALDPLRNRDDFRLMMMDLAMPAEPFAATR